MNHAHNLPPEPPASRSVLVPMMTPAEVRSIRGGMSRAAFAAKLGVTPLTVYRWELPSGSAESRSPRGRHLAALRTLGDPDHEAAPSESESRLLADLARGRWDAVEHDGLAYLTSERSVTPERQAFVATAVAQARLLGHLDARGAFLMLAPALASARLLPPELAARAHVVAAMIHSASNEPLFNLAKAQMHLASARSLSSSGFVGSVSALATVAELDALSRSDAVAFARAYGRLKHELDGFTEPVTRVLVLEIQAAAMRIAGDMAGEQRQLETALSAARALGFAAAEARILAELARLAHLTTGPDEALLQCDEAGDALRRAGLRPAASMQIERTRAAVHASKETLALNRTQSS